MTDTPTTPPLLTAPSLVSLPQIGFLTILHEPAGLVGGYLLTNHWGRPLEFRHTTAVQPNRVHEILYGPTLLQYLHADLIGKTLIEKSSTRPTLIVTDSRPALAVGSRVLLPVIAVNKTAEPMADLAEFRHGRSRVPLLCQKSELIPELTAILDRLDASIDLAEPFTRLHEALFEARKLGGNQRAA